MHRLCAIVVVGLLASGCAAAPVRRVGERRSADPTWLKAGDERVRFVGVLEVPGHVGIERGALSRFWEWLTGTERSRALARPFGVAVAADGRLAVTDPGARVVRVYLPRQNEDLELRDGLATPLAAAFVDELVVVADGQAGGLLGFDATTGARRELSWKLPAFTRPTGLAFDAARGRLFVVDALQHRVHVVSTTGDAPRAFGSRGEAAGAFNFPTHVAVDARGHVWVADSLNFRVQHFDEQLAVVGQLGGQGDEVGSTPRAKGLAVDTAGTVWVVDGSADVVQGFDAQGRLVGVFGGSGAQEGRFWLPAGLACDVRGRLYVADTWNGRVQAFEVEPVVTPAPDARAEASR
jgi:sugar lactone lactonase YvrE